MKKIFEYKVLFMFVLLVLGVTYYNSLTMKELIENENMNEIIMNDLN